MARRGKTGGGGNRERPALRDVYGICGTGRRACKIGVSDDAEGRLRALHTGSPVDYVLAHKEKVPRDLAHKVENTARRDLVDQGKSKTREWVRPCTPREAADAIRSAYERIRGRNY